MKLFARYLMLIAILSCCLFPVLTRGAEQTHVVAVVDFSNVSGWNLPDSDEVSNEILSTLLSQTGLVTVVERSKLVSVIREQGLSMTGLVDSTNSAVRVGKLLGAEHLVTGAILAMDAKETRFSGYGVTNQKVDYELTLNVKLIKVNTGKLEYSAFHTAQEMVINGERSGTVPSAVIRKLLMNALSEAVKKMEPSLTIEQPVVMEKKCYVKIASEPSGADVEVDNVFYGNTPLRIDLIPGVHQLRITLAGYELWQKNINASEGLNVNAKLVKKPPETNININIK